MPENLKENNGIESRSDAGEPGKKKKGSSQGTMPDHTKKNEGIKSGRDVGDPKTK